MHAGEDVVRPMGRKGTLPLHGGLVRSVGDSMRPMHVGAAGADHSYAKGAGSIVVIDGTFGNRNLYDVSTADPEAGYFAAWMGLNLNPTHGFMHYDVSAGRIDAAFQGSTN